jgi:hypothetical protein
MWVSLSLVLFASVRTCRHSLRVSWGERGGSVVLLDMNVLQFQDRVSGNLPAALEAPPDLCLVKSQRVLVRASVGLPREVPTKDDAAPCREDPGGGLSTAKVGAGRLFGHGGHRIDLLGPVSC